MAATRGAFSQLLAPGLFSVIYEDLEDGAEILYEELTGMDENAVAQLVRPKNKLAIFEPVRE